MAAGVSALMKWFHFANRSFLAAFLAAAVPTAVALIVAYSSVTKMTPLGWQYDDCNPPLAAAAGTLSFVVLLPPAVVGFGVPSFLHPFHSVSSASADNSASPLHLVDAKS